jgi:predicted anti-sigma-YlaC factor YlaD
MRDGHVIEILESGPFDALGESELAAVRAHAERCAECRRAYDAARVSSLLLRERAAETFEPPPFFQTRVMAALRERQAEQAWALPRLWKTAGALFASMLATVAALFALTFLAPGATQSDTADETAAEEVYSAEESILAQGGASDEEMTYDQVLSVVYEPEGEGGAR